MNIKKILIIVGVILFISGIIISFIPFDPSKGRARDARREFDIDGIQTTLELYSSRYNIYPQSLEELKSKDPKISITDPKTNLLYEYQVKSGGNDYQLCVDFEKEKDKCVSKTDCKMCGEKTPQ